MQEISTKELKEYRYLFPVSKKFIYLNHAGVAPISLRVHDAIMQYSAEALNEGYTAGPRWTKNFEKVRSMAARLIGALPEEIAFVKNTSHGLSLLASGMEFSPGDEVILSDLEFPANVYPWMALEKKGVVLKKIPSRDFEMALSELPKLISNRTRVVSLSSATFSTGYRTPLAEIGILCRERGILFCVDAIQSLGAFELNVVHDHVDVLSADAHKWLLGPEGIGIFFLRKNLLDQVRPVLWGWNSVEHALDFDHIDFHLKSTAGRYEEGSMNGMGVTALGAALELILEIGLPRISERILTLNDLLIDGLKKLGLKIANSEDPRYRSGMIFTNFSDESEPSRLNDLNEFLFAQGIYASVRGGNLRFSPHFYNTEDELEQTLKVLEEFLKKS